MTVSLLLFEYGIKVYIFRNGKMVKIHEPYFDLKITTLKKIPKKCLVIFSVHHSTQLILFNFENLSNSSAE